jgi:dTDP-4-dehydrorhamnose reductase
MRILLFGKNGQVGWELQRSLAPLGQVTALDYPEINFGEPDSLVSIVEEVEPRLIINAAAYTAVDRAESERDLSHAINAAAPGVLAEIACKQKAALIHYSTDYVFDGKKGSPYFETDTPNPLNVYGITKLQGEQAILNQGGSYLILRTSWVYSTRQGGFVNKVLQWSREQRVLRVVADQIGGPTWCRLLAEATAQIAAMASNEPHDWILDRKGLYHFAGSGSASRLEWAKAILESDPKLQEQIVEDIQPALTSEFPTPAERPLYAAMDCEKFTRVFGLRLPPWKVALKMALDSW